MVVCVQLIHSSLGDRGDIFVFHFIIIIKSKVSTFPALVIFSAADVSGVVVK